MVCLPIAEIASCDDFVGCSGAAFRDDFSFSLFHQSRPPCRDTGRADTATAAVALFSAKSVADRDAAIEELENADPKDPLVPYALGAAEFFQSLEKLAIGLNRHGFASPQSFVLPLLRLPDPAARRAGAAEYDGFRDILIEFRDGMGGGRRKTRHGSNGR